MSVGAAVGAPSGAIILLSIMGIAAEAAPTAAPAIAPEGAPTRIAPEGAPTGAPTGVPTEIVVLASQLRAAELATVPVSVTQLDTAAIGAASLQHVEELASLVPNFNWSGEGSRARYFQIRGTGELEQYDGAPNPSVGFVIDDIDLSGIGAVATTFDLKGIEVLRGPQGVRYGANALAGLIYVQGNEPTAVRPSRSSNSPAAATTPVRSAQCSVGQCPAAARRWRIAWPSSSTTATAFAATPTWAATTPTSVTN
jgi:outer membrane receptor protein involved in Fe transport